MQGYGQMDCAAAGSAGGRGLIPAVGIQMVFPPLGFKTVEKMQPGSMKKHCSALQEVRKKEY